MFRVSHSGFKQISTPLTFRLSHISASVPVETTLTFPAKPSFSFWALSAPFLSQEVDGCLFLVGEGEVLDKLSNVSNPLITLDVDHDERQYSGFISALS